MSADLRRLRLTEPRELLPGRVRGTFEPAPSAELRLRLPLNAIDRAGRLLAEHGARFVTMFIAENPERSLAAVLALRGQLVLLRAALDGDNPIYPALSVDLPAARWVERELHDRAGVTPLGHPDLEPITEPDASRIRRRVRGADAFVIPYGPIRSGIFEAIQFVIETGGEDVAHLETRPFFKHRRLEERFSSLSLDHGTYVAERVAGIASVAHAAAYAQAVERALGVDPPLAAKHWRALYAELERIANHFDVCAKEAETAALAVGQARFMMLKEDVLRLQAELTGSRFARGVIVPGGVRFGGRVALDELGERLRRLEGELRRDRRLLLGTTSFTDRLIGSGELARETAHEFGAVGPLARGSGLSTDARFERPYGAYERLGFEVITRGAGDAMARVEVRLAEIDQSLHLLRQAIDRLRRTGEPHRVDLPPTAGEALGWTEAPQGELVYWVEVADGLVRHVRIASPSLRNWALFAESYGDDVLTDFAFTEHSFGLTPAGADR
jgi:formate hydrogenlyase subunit 5